MPPNEKTINSITPDLKPHPAKLPPDFSTHPMKLTRLPNCVVLLLLVLMPLTASALLMRPNGPESVIIQIKESLRQSDALDAQLAELAAFENSASLTVQQRWVGPKYLEMVAFPSNLTEPQANAIVAQLQQLACVEKVVAVSAYNLVFKAGDFARPYAPAQTISDVARRGFDVDRITRPRLPDIGTATQTAHLLNHVIVRWKDEYIWKADQTGFLQTISQFNTNAGCHVVNEHKFGPNHLIQVLEFDSLTASVAQKLLHYASSEWVDYAQPDYIYSANDVTPNDTYYSYLWSLPQIKCPRAWDPSFGGTTGVDSLKVAIGDTGANYFHIDLSSNNAGGFNFVANNNTPYDDHGHGTHVASILGAQGNNGTYMTGVAWDVGLMHIKVLDRNGAGTSDTVAKGIKYAYANGAHTINLSLGTDPTSSIDTVEYEAVREAREKGMIVVAAAGNGYRFVNVGQNSDDSNRLVNPASIPTDNMIAVGATDSSDNRASFSNYGAYRVELGAPGVNIYGISIQPGIALEPMSGTSQAAPHVSGVLQLVKTKYPWEGYLGIRDRVLMATDDVAALSPGSSGGGFRTGGRLNASKALAKRTMIRNLSTRGKVENGDRILIGGFNVGGNNAPDAVVKNDLKVVIRGLGPSLPPLSVSRLPNPKIRLNNTAGAPIAMNNSWTELTYAEQVELAGYGLTPTDTREAAMIVNLTTGAYTVFLESEDGQFGVGVFEIYEVENNNNETTRLLNVSTRCPVGTGEEVAIAGTIIGDPNQANDPAVPKRRVLTFGKGPSIPVSGAFVPGQVHAVLPALPIQYGAAVLPNPYLELHDVSGAIIAANDNWRDMDGSSTGLEDKLTESMFAPTNNNESAIWPTLRPGQYTAILRDTTGSQGIGLVEFYEF